MVSLLGRTQQSIAGIERLLHPLELSWLGVGFVPDCKSEALKAFCGASLRAGRKLANSHRKNQANSNDQQGQMYPINDLPLPNLPSDDLIASFNVTLFSNVAVVSRGIKVGCLDCILFGDLSFDVPFDAEGPGSGDHQHLIYRPSDESLSISIARDRPIPDRNSGKIVSFTDLDEAAMVVWSLDPLINNLTLRDAFIRTASGQEVYLNNPTVVNMHGDSGNTKVFVCRIGPRGSKNRRDGECGGI